MDRGARRATGHGAAESAVTEQLSAVQVFGPLRGSTVQSRTGDKLRRTCPTEVSFSVFSQHFSGPAFLSLFLSLRHHWLIPTPFPQFQGPLEETFKISITI